MSTSTKHKKDKLPNSCVYQEKKVVERDLKDHQPSLKDIKVEDKYQKKLDNVGYNTRIKQIATRFQVNHLFVNLESEN